VLPAPLLLPLLLELLLLLLPLLVPPLDLLVLGAVQAELEQVMPAQQSESNSQTPPAVVQAWQTRPK
jgi:hypothetical protein